MPASAGRASSDSNNDEKWVKEHKTSTEYILQYFSLTSLQSPECILCSVSWVWKSRFCKVEYLKQGHRKIQSLHVKLFKISKLMCISIPTLSGS